MKKVNILVKLVADEQYTNAVKTEIPKLVESMQVAEGCISANLFQAADDPHHFYILQKWMSEVHWARHYSSDAVKVFSNQFKGVFDQATITHVDELL